MIDKTSQEFIADAESLLTDVASNHVFLKIKTPCGTVVLVSESEYQILLKSIKALVSYIAKKNLPHSPQKE